MTVISGRTLTTFKRNRIRDVIMNDDTLDVDAIRERFGLAEDDNVYKVLRRLNVPEPVLNKIYENSRQIRLKGDPNFKFNPYFDYNKLNGCKP